MRIFQKIFCLSLVSCLLSLSAQAAEYNAALVADLDTGQILYQEHANALNYPASLTKIMTLYLAFDALEHGRLHLDDYLIVSAAAANASPVKLGLTSGSKIKVEDAIKAVAVVSANDVARVLAENLKGGKEGNFAGLMPQVATEIGLSKTNFENSSGLPDDDHLSTARDIALLSMAVYKHFPQYWKYFGIRSWEYNGKTYNNGNRLLGSYPGCDGMKTGFTNKSKYSLVATARRGGKHLMSVVLGAANKDVRAAIATRMLDKGFGIIGNNPPPEGGSQSASNEVAMRDAGWGKNTDSDIDPTPARATPGGLRLPTRPQGAGGAGVQFGAFSSRNSAQIQQKTVKSSIGLDTSIESTGNGMFRVRANGLGESAAQSACARAKSSKLDCFVFH